MFRGVGGGAIPEVRTPGPGVVLAWMTVMGEQPLPKEVTSVILREALPQAVGMRGLPFSVLEG